MRQKAERWESVEREKAEKEQEKERRGMRKKIGESLKLS